MYTISEATENDIADIIAIAEKTWWPTYSGFLSKGQIDYMLSTIYAPETMRKEMRNGSQTFLLLRDETGPQGFASFGRRPESPLIFKLHKLYVLPANHAKGYGRALIQAIINRLLDDHIHTLELNVNRLNPARIFYEKTGFKIIREEDIQTGPYWMNDFVMRMDF